MANLSDVIAQIRQAIFGKDIRENIASGIETINAEQNDLKSTFNQLIINAGSSNAEIVDARGTFAKLRDRLNNSDSVLNSIAVSVKSFGALGDGVQDDTPFIQDALDYAGVNGGTVIVPSGTYKIKHTISIPSNVTLVGEGQTSILSADIASDGFTMLIFSSQSNVQIRNLKLLGNASKRTLTMPMNGIAMNNGACYCTISKVFFEDMGYTVVNVDNPGTSENNEDALGACINIDTNETHETTKGNLIEDCTFIDADKRCAFAIRIFTEWWNSTDPESYQSKATFNTVRGCYFDGFTFNVIEVAGPGTEFNLIEHNISVNCTAYAGIEADKGARRNIFAFNIVRDMKPLNSIQAAYRDQGLAADSANGYPTRHSQGNIWHGNIAKNLVEHTLNTASVYAAMLLINAENALITDFIVDTITPATANKASTGAIVMLSGCSNVSIKGLETKDVPVGVYVSSGVDGLTIDSCNISATKYAYETQGSGTVNTNISILNSRINMNGAQYPFLFSNETNMLIKGNIINGFTGGVYTPNSKGVLIAENIVSRTGGGNGFVITADQALVNNMFIGCSYGYTEGRNVVNGNHSDIDGKSITFMTAAPTAGTWFKGDIVYNSNPAANAVLGWICVSNGVPGTWKAIGTISA